MGRINMSRVIAGGLLAGLVMNAIDFLVNGILLAPAWAEATVALGIDPESTMATSAVGWTTFDFLCGIVLVWIYAAIRPRFGPGPSTAAIASLTVWGVTHLAFASFVFMDLFPLTLVAQSGAGGLVAALAGGHAGCWIYREEPVALLR
jgi:hypothetical protein